MTFQKGIWLTILFLTLSISNQGFAQSPTPFTQTVRGEVVDLDSQSPLVGVNVVVAGSNPIMGASTDAQGRFAIAHVPIGRVTLLVSYIGFESRELTDLLVTSGKELVVRIELIEAVIESEGVVVEAEGVDGVAINEMASVSARSFSVEQTQRYAAGFSDPARMALTFAGVSSGGDDLLNEIVVRGNSPKGILWRLEGVEIPNPNHFGEEGASGGGVSMLSASTLTRSDFFTSAFPAEYGNALSGVFDLSLRTGNRARTEYTLQMGVLGVEASLEGPFSSNYDGSYLINYRYSTLGILNNFGVLPEESIQYQDLSFKVALPTRKAGNFTLFGLGGDAQDIYGKAQRDSTAWTSFDDRLDGQFNPRMGVLGASHVYLFGANTYLKTILSLAGEQREDYELMLIPTAGYRLEPIFEQDTRTWAGRVSVQLNHKFDAQRTVRIGAIWSRQGYDFLARERDGQSQPWFTFIQDSGKTSLLQGYVQAKLRPSASLTLTPGLHITHFALNGNTILEPRFGATWQFTSTQALTFGIGRHSRMEPIALYLLERTRPDGTAYQPHRNLELTKAWHVVLGYDRQFANNSRLKLEAYWQQLDDVPVSTDATDPLFSSLNAEGVWAILGNDGVLTNAGTAQNYGIEASLERYLKDGYYYLITGSLFEAEYTPLDGHTYPSRYAGRFVSNVLGGKEFNVSQRNLIGVNLRLLVAGGNRYTPLDLARSREYGEPIYDRTRPYASQLKAYYRLDVGMSYTINRSSLTHMIRLDLQNVTGRENIQGFDYNDLLEAVPYYHAGLIPVLSYQVSF